MFRSQVRGYRARVRELSRREREVAVLVSQGLTNREIATRLFVSERTAEFHVEQIRNKLGFHSRTEVAGWMRGQAPPVAPEHLPAQLTRFVGRAGDVEAVRRLLGRSRIVTLTGPGGSGKTRLAVAVAEAELAAYADGCWFADLQAVFDERLVAEEVARSLGVPEIAQLSGERRLLVLDNCEQVLNAARRAVREIVTVAPGVRVLATSRTPLRISGEATWAVGPMTSHDAVELLVDRTQLAAPDIDLETVDRGLLDAMCAELDRLPLAIELIAPAVRVMSLSDLAGRLRRGPLSVATGGPDGRQETLAATIEWSYDLLPAEDQQLLRCLGVFAGPFLLASATAVAGNSRNSDATATVLHRLVEQSLVVAERLPERSTRYRLLLTVRAFARDRAAAAGELVALREAHARHYVELARTAGEELAGRGQAQWIARIDDELDEYRAAAQWAVENNPTLGLVLVSGLTWFWGMRGRIREGRRVIDEALAATPDLSRERGHALIAAGWLARLQGDTDLGLRLHQESVDVLGRFDDDPLDLGRAIVWLGEAYQETGNLEEARQQWLLALELLAPRETSEPLGYALVLLAGLDARDAPERSLAQAERARAIFSELGNPRGQAMARCWAARAHASAGRWERAWTENAGSYAELLELGAISDLTPPLETAIAIADSRGRSELAAEMRGAMSTLTERTGRRWGGDQADERARVEHPDAWSAGSALTPGEVGSRMRVGLAIL